MTRQQLDDKIESLMQYIFENTELMNKTNDNDRKRIYKQRIDTRKKELGRILLIQPINGGKKSSKNKISGGSGAVGHTVMPHQYYGAEQPTMSGTGAHITSIDLSGGDAPMARGGIPENFTQSLVGGTKHKSKKSLSKKSDKKKPSKKSKKVSGGMAVENSPQSVMDLKQSDLIGGTKHKKKSSKKSSDKKKSSKKNKSSGGNPFTGRY